MNKILFIAFVFCMAGYVQAQETHTITANGTAFDPETLIVKPYDIVKFEAGSGHPVLQVSESTWNSDGSTPLPGGFSFPSGSGTFTAEMEETLYYVCSVHVGGGMKGKIIVTSAMSNETNPTLNSFKIYPSYVTDFLNIMNPGNLLFNDVRIFDMSGRIVLKITEDFSSLTEFRIDLNNLNKGFYFISIETGNSHISRKFIKL